MTFKLTKDSVDKWFKTAFGYKVECVYGNGTRYVFNNPSTRVIFTTDNNGYCMYQGTEFDIISEWKEPIEREVIVHLGCDGNVWIGSSCSNSRPDAYPIASAKVKLIEGEFA